MNVIEKTQSDLLPIFESYLVDTGFAKEPKLLYDSYQHIMSIKGKRIRPLLTLMACDAFGGEVNKAVPQNGAKSASIACVLLVQARARAYG